MKALQRSLLRVRDTGSEFRLNYPSRTRQSQTGAIKAATRM